MTRIPKNLMAFPVQALVDCMTVITMSEKRQDVFFVKIIPKNHNMSTKIFNGYISKLSIEQLLKKFVPLVAKFEEMKKELYYKELVKEVTFAIDADPSLDHNNSLYEQHHKNEKEMNNTIIYQSRNDNDFSCNCCVFPMSKGKTLILFYCESSEMTDFWKSLPFISEYHYQNSTDKPEYLSTKDWSQRRRDWDRAVGYDAPRTKGYCFQFTTERLPISVRTKECNKFVPNKSNRALNLMHENYMDKECKRLKQLPENKDSEYSWFSKAKDNWCEYKKTPEYTKLRTEIMGVLVKIDFEFEKKY